MELAIIRLVSSTMFPVSGFGLEGVGVRICKESGALLVLGLKCAFEFVTLFVIQVLLRVIGNETIFRIHHGGAGRHIFVSLFR